MDAPFCLALFKPAWCMFGARFAPRFARFGRENVFRWCWRTFWPFFSLLRPGKQFCDGATPSDITDSPWIFKPSCFPADACFPLLCFLWRHFFDFLSLATLHGAMADGNAAFDLNVRLEEDENGNLAFDLNEAILDNGNGNGNLFPSSHFVLFFFDIQSNNV